MIQFGWIVLKVFEWEAGPKITYLDRERVYLPASRVRCLVLLLRSGANTIESLKGLLLILSQKEQIFLPVLFVKEELWIVQSSLSSAAKVGTL